MNDAWIADRMKHDRRLGHPQGVRHGQVHEGPDQSVDRPARFDVPEPVKAAAIEAISAGSNAYTVTQGIPELAEKIQAAVDAQFHHGDRQVLITAGTSGDTPAGHVLRGQPGRRGDHLRPVFRDVSPPGDAGWGPPVLVDTYPNFRIDVDRVAPLLSDRTKCIVVNSPVNPTGVVATAEEMRELAELCRRREILLISDEVYRAFCFDRPFASPASWNEDVLVVDGFSKAYGMTGWRLGCAHGPSRLIQEMAKLQQFSFVCAPSMAQYGRRRRPGPGPDRSDRCLSPQTGHGGRRPGEDFELACPEGAFYAFPARLGEPEASSSPKRSGTTS